MTIDSGLGDDSIANHGASVTITSGDGFDSIKNNSTGVSVSIDGGSGDDSIVNQGSDVTINAGTGNDYVYIREDAKNNVILYKPGDGDDTIEGSNETYTLKILTEDASIVSKPSLSGDDMIITVGDNTILLKGGRDNPPHIILGESGSSGGGSGDGGDGGGGSSGGKGGNDGGKDNSSGGKSSDADKGDRDASGNQSASGSAGSSGASSGLSDGGSRGGNSRGGNRISFEKIYEELTRTSTTPMPAYQNVSNDTAINTPATVSNVSQNVLGITYGGSFFDVLTTATPATATNPNFYAGGNQVIDNYTSGQKIMMGALPTGYAFDGDNFVLASETGTLLIQDVKDKVIEFTDSAGNDFLKAYSATNPGLIDGHGLTGFEVIAGSDLGSDLIFAGDNGSSLWGGNGVHSDTLVGGNGVDIFAGGKTQGSDTFVNVSANDIVFLSDSTLSDIVATAGNDNAVAIAFNTGNVIMVGSSDTLSAAFMLEDGSAYRYNHVAKAWQPA